MRLLSRERFRGNVAVVVVVTMTLLGVRSTHAADTNTPSAAPDTTKGGGPAADTTGTDTSPAPPAAAPQLQLQDEGPTTARPDGAHLVRSRPAPVDDSDERPFWKSWIFWTVTGVLVVGAVSMVAYSSSRTNASLAPCPPEVLVSLGCYGAGR